MLKQAPFRISFLLLIAVLFAPISKLHAQATDPAPITNGDVVTGGDPQPSGDPNLVGSPDPNMMMTDDDVVTGGDPQPSGDGGAMIHSALEAAFVSLKLS